jgi:putative transcriptional regulator
MTKETEEVQDELRELEQAIERAADYVQRGGLKKPRFVFARARVDAKAIREGFGMSRQDFAMEFGISLRTLENWEDGRREPEGPARTLLVAIQHEPDAVRRAVMRYRGLALSAGRRATASDLRPAASGALKAGVQRVSAGSVARTAKEPGEELERGRLAGRRS